MIPPNVNLDGENALTTTKDVEPVYFVHHMQEVWIVGKNTKYCSPSRYEDFSCSNQLDPWYQLFDHTQYFDQDYKECGIVEGYLGADFWTLPQHKPPSNYIPPMPSFMVDIYEPEVQGGYEGVLPLL